MVRQEGQEGHCGAKKTLGGRFTLWYNVHCIVKERSEARTQAHILFGGNFMMKQRIPLKYMLPILCSTLALFLASCGGTASSAPSAPQLLKSAQSAIQKVTAYHFNYDSQNIGTTGSLPIQKADGDVVVPDKLKANATVLFNGQPLTTQLVAIGDNEYVFVLTNWQATTGLFDPRTLSDPHTGVAALIGQLQHPSTPSDSSVNGTPCWSITGKLDASALAAFTGGGAPAGSTVDVTTCVGKNDNLPYLITIKGVAATGDSAQTVRTFKLSKFNENVTITAPQLPMNPTPTTTP